MTYTLKDLASTPTMAEYDVEDVEKWANGQSNAIDYRNNSVTGSIYTPRNGMIAGYDNIARLSSSPARLRETILTLDAHLLSETFAHRSFRCGELSAYTHFLDVFFTTKTATESEN